MSIKSKCHRIIFYSTTPMGKGFDIALIGCILFSVLVVMLDSVESIRMSHGLWLTQLEWLFTILFSAEYILRLYCSPKPIQYAKSFFGIVDLLAILPTYIGLILPSAHFLTVIRILRVLRVFRILKFVQYIKEAQLLVTSIKQSFRKIVLFILAVFSIAVILGSIMYVIEGEAGGFTSIPKSIYWAIVTLTTVGYGDISPTTTVGQIVATFIMILGYSIIVVPSGFVGANMINSSKPKSGQNACETCGQSLQNTTG